MENSYEFINKNCRLIADKVINENFSLLRLKIQYISKYGVLCSEEQIHTYGYKTNDNLNFEENTTIFNSWVEGISKKGIESLFNIEELNKGLNEYEVNKLSKFLLRNEIINSQDLINYGLDNPKDKITSLNMIKNYLYLNKNYVQVDKILDKIMDFNLSIEDLYYIIESSPRIINKILHDYPKEEVKKLFSHRDWNVRKIVQNNPLAKNFEEVNDLIPLRFGTNSYKVSRNLEATNYKEYELFFSDTDANIRFRSAKNLEAPKLDEYKKLFTDKYSEIRTAAASNPNATRFEEYKKLFFDKEYYATVRNAAASNPNAPKFDEYKVLFKDPFCSVRINVAENPNATRFEEYKKLFKDKHWQVNNSLIKSPGATKFEYEYKQLFLNEHNWSSIAKNPEATKFEEFRELFKSNNWYVIEAIGENPKAKNFPEFEAHKIKLKNKYKYYLVNC